MDETTGAIPAYAHTHGVYGEYGRGYGRNDDGVLVDLINKNDLNNSVREVGRAVDISSQSTSAGIAGLAKGQSDNTIATSGLITDLGRDVNNGVHNTLVQNLDHFNRLDKTVTQGNSLIIGQGQNILAEMARCCCEIKERFCESDKENLAEHNATRALITDNRMHDLEDRAARAELKLSQAEQTNAIIAALSGNGNK